VSGAEPRRLTLAFACPACGEAVEGPLAPSMTCAHCGTATDLPEAAELATTGTASACPVCGSRDVYQQRDFNRVVGLTLVAIGLAIGPFTRWIGTVAFVGLDAALFLLVPPVAVCYACEAQLRGFRREDGPPAFDIAVHDAYRFGKRHPPRRDRAIAGPRSRLLLQEGRVRS
jgi:uncharacterized protein (DUF983 family)